MCKLPKAENIYLNLEKNPVYYAFEEEEFPNDIVDINANPLKKNFYQ